MTLDMTVKFAEGSDTIIEGYGVPFGEDLDGQRFESDTDRCHDWFPKGGRPILHDHGFHKSIKLTPVGRELSTTPDEIGDFVRAELDKSNKYYEGIAQLVREGKLGWSSAAPGPARRRGRLIGPASSREIGLGIARPSVPSRHLLRSRRLRRPPGAEFFRAPDRSRVDFRLSFA